MRTLDPSVSDPARASTVGRTDNDERGLGVALVIGALRGGVSGALTGLLSGACCLGWPIRPPGSSPQPEWLLNVALFFGGAGAALGAGEAMAWRARGARARWCLLLGGLAAPLAGAAPSLSLSAWREGRWQWEVDLAQNKYYDPRFLLVLGVALALAQGLAGRPPHRDAVGRRLGRAALTATIATLALWTGLRILDGEAGGDLFDLMLLFVSACVISATFAGGLELARPVAERLRRLLEGGSRLSSKP